MTAYEMRISYWSSDVCSSDLVRFAVWAPNARRVSVVGDFNSWDGRRHVMRARRPSGVWEIFIPRLPIGSTYKYEILGPHGMQPLKDDPVALQAQPEPLRSEERRVGKACVRMWRSRW